MKFKQSLLLLLFTAAVIFNNLSAQEERQDQPAQAREHEETMLIDSEFDSSSDIETLEETSLTTFSFFDFIRMILVLLFVILCIYGVFFLLKKVSAVKYDETEMINIILTKNISPNKMLHVVEIGTGIYIIGSSENSLNLITEIQDQETIDRFRLIKGENKVPAHKSFYSYLAGVMNPGKKVNRTAHIPADNIDSAGFLKNQRQRIEKL